MSDYANGHPDVELQLDPKIIQNALNRFFICEPGFSFLGLNFEFLDLEFIQTENTLNSIDIETCFGWGGAYTGDKFHFRLSLQGDHNKNLHIKFLQISKLDFVGPDHVPILEYDNFKDLKTALIALFALEPLLQDLTELETLLGSTQKFYLKVTEQGQALLGIAASSGISNELFRDRNTGILESATARGNRFAIAVDQNLLKARSVEIFNDLLDVDSQNLTLHNLNEDDIHFNESRLSIHGGLTYRGPCGLIDADFEVDYTATADFSLLNGDIQIDLGIDLDFANAGEETEAFFCGVFEILYNYLPPLNAALLTPLTAVISTLMSVGIGQAIAEHLLDDMATGAIPLDNYHQNGIHITRLNNSHWRVTIYPTEALGLYGSLLWPMRFVHMSLDHNGQIFIYGDQDTQLAIPGDQEAVFSGQIDDLLGSTNFEIDQMDLGDGFEQTTLYLDKSNRALLAIDSFEIIDDEHQCFSVTNDPLFDLSYFIESDETVSLIKGTKILSPRSKVPVSVQFGPYFIRTISADNSVVGYQAPWHPPAGTQFTARLKVNYKINNGNNLWESHSQFFDLNGQITCSNLPFHDGLQVNEWAQFYEPDDIFQIANEIETELGQWELPLDPTDLDLVEVYTTDHNILKLQIENQQGQLLAQSESTGTRSIQLINSPVTEYRITTEATKGVGEAYFYIKRERLTLKIQQSFPEGINGFLLSGSLLVVASAQHALIFSISRDGSLDKLGGIECASQNIALDKMTHQSNQGILISDTERQYWIPANTRKLKDTPEIVTPVNVNQAYMARQNKLNISIINTQNGKQTITSTIDFDHEITSSSLIGSHLRTNHVNGAVYDCSINNPEQPVIVTHYQPAANKQFHLIQGNRVIMCDPDRVTLSIYTRSRRKGNLSHWLKKQFSKKEARFIAEPINNNELVTEKRYVGNRKTMEVHDLRHEKAQCQIKRIIESGTNGRTFNKDHLGVAHALGYDNCAYCLGRSVR